MTQQALALFQENNIRRIRDPILEKWYFSVVDIVSALSGSTGKDIGAYRRKLKQRLIAEGSEVVTNCHGFKLLAPDGKKRETDVADVEAIFRIIQSIPSPNAEPNVAKRGGSVAGDARKKIEQETGKSVINNQRHLPI